ncbi:MAG: two-component regulator propeller domain-containing protein [Candidatus Pseudobacter hemicellulosilyticus]|uniref:Two-component regulator propeller domain-containing protein n=1 Tax=Candidatus Pseudobacter hemicellulosilyticus TaxID=3121375 RepID=A0AAJ5WUK2_9BACT|nr:MAG: two-component regulator propeller domain-containing protein [Pseudobacter sp.]
MYRLLIYIIALLLLPGLQHAQPKRYVFTRLSVKDGLASDHVYSILQDKKGFMWFGTANGLQRFDGRKTVMFRSSMGTEKYLPPVGISQVFQDTCGQFWVRSGNEVGIFDPTSFRYKKPVIRITRDLSPRSDFILWQDRKGGVFLIITRYGILSYNPANNSFEQNEQRIRTPRNWNVTALAEDPRNGQYWMAADSGLAVFDPEHKTLSYHSQNPRQLPILQEKLFTRPITTLFIDSRHRFWIATWPAEEEYYHCYDLRTNQFLPDAAGMEQDDGNYAELRGFTEQSNGQLWAYGRMKLLEHDSALHRFHYIRDRHIEDFGMRYDFVHCFFEDREKNIWLGTDKGIYIFNPGRQLFNSVGLRHTMEAGPRKDLAVTSLLEIGGGKLLVGSWGLGPLLYDSQFVKIPNRILEGSGGDGNYTMVWDMELENRTGLVWIGCQMGRLILYDPVSQRTQFYKVPAAQGKTIRQVLQDKAGNIWLATQYGHVLRWDRSVDHGKNFLQGFKLIQQLNTIVYKMRLDREGYIWIATHNKGLYKIDPYSGALVSHYHSRKGEGQSLFSDVVSDFVPYNDSLVYIANNIIDVLNIRTGQVRHLTTDNGLPNATCRSLELDNDGNLWIGMLNGICRYNPRRHIFTLFGLRDGIIDAGFEENGSLKMDNGRMVFGNPHDFVYFDPATVYSSPSPLDVSITDFKLFNSYLPPDSIMKLDKVRLKYTQNSITIEFAALSFLQRDKTVYYYWMEGVDKDWIRADQGLFANYSLLPPGPYTFKLKCENADGLESRNITTLHIDIAPPFWQTWWFITLIGMAVAAVIYGIHRIRVNRLLDMEKVRTRIARDLHDDMGSTLSTINILSEMAKMKVTKDVEKTSEYLNKISDNSSRMMEAMDDIVWSINPMNDSMQRVTARMREFATGVLEARNIDVNFRVDDEIVDLKLDMEARRDIFLIFKEAVNNLAKYAQCRNATIDISVNRHTLLMKIQDDGIGFDVQSADSGNGLINMKKRAQSLNGQLKVDSVPGAGTRVVLEVPLT